MKFRIYILESFLLNTFNSAVTENKLKSINKKDQKIIIPVPLLALESCYLEYHRFK